MILYISRKGSRRISNEMQLVAELQSYVDSRNQRIISQEGAAESDSQGLLLPLELVVFNGDPSVVDTVRLFNRARVIIGAHGAGLANMLWANPSASIIELAFSATSYFGLYWGIASGTPYFLS